MTGTQPTNEPPLPADVMDLVPSLRSDFERRDLGGECVVWSPLAPEPAALDAVATVMLDVIDGQATIRELAADVHEVVGVPLDAAEQQVRRVVERFEQLGLLTSSISTSSAEETIAAREAFVADSTACSENASRLGTVTLHLQFGNRIVRVACDSRRAARRLRDELDDYVVGAPDDAPLGFVLTAPQGLKRSHSLMERAGFVLSEGRGLDAGLHALASHLTALLPPPPGTVRIRARALAAGDETMLCLFPLLYFPSIAERDVVAAGVSLVDRLALDIDVQTGQIAHAEVPWPALGALAPGRGHLGTGGRRPITTVAYPTLPLEPAPSAAGFVATIAASGMHGTPAELLDAAVAVVRIARLQSIALRSMEPAPDDCDRLLALFLRAPG